MIYTLLLVVAGPVAMALMFRVRPRELEAGGAPALRYLAAPYVMALTATFLLVFGIYQWFNPVNQINPGDLMLFSFIPLAGALPVIYLAIYFLTYRVVLRTSTLDITQWPFGSRQLKLNQLLSIEKTESKTILRFADGENLVIYQGLSGSEYFLERIKALLPGTPQGL